MEVPDESVVYEEIEKSLKDSPSSATWDEVEQLEITNPRALSWRRYKERLSGAEAEIWAIPDCDNQLNLAEVGQESEIWKYLANQMLQTFNRLFPHLKVNDLNDPKCSVTVDEIKRSYIDSMDDDELMKNAVLIDVLCDPIVKRLSEKIGDVGICCASDSLRSRSKTVPINYICGKRTDLSGTTDWVMRRYGGNREESSMYVNLMWWVSCFMYYTGGYLDTKTAVDSAMGIYAGGTSEANTSSDGDRTSHMIDRTKLANAVKSSCEKSICAAIRRVTGIEETIATRRGYVKVYGDIYRKISRSIVDSKYITPTVYLTSRYTDGMCMSFFGIFFCCDFGKTFNWMNGSIYLLAFETAIHYNDLSDAVLDLKYKESHNYVIFAKGNSNFSSSDHFEALYVALTTFDEEFKRFDNEIKRRMLRYRCSVIVYSALWPRYRASERARRFVGSLRKEERSKLIERGRRCIQGDIHIEENIWLDAICSNYNNRRREIRDRGYTDTLLYVLGVEDDSVARDHIQSAVKAIGMRPFDTALEFVMSLGSIWLAQLALRSVKGSAEYNDLVAEFSDLLSTFSLSSLPIISDNTITPCESICGSLCLRFNEMLTIASGMKAFLACEKMVSTLAALVAMVSLDPYRCIAYQADMLLI